MNVHTKRVYDPPAKSDGLRVLVDRLWPRGLSKEAAKIDIWAMPAPIASASRAASNSSGVMQSSQTSKMIAQPATRRLPGEGESLSPKSARNADTKSAKPRMAMTNSHPARPA